ncbi:TPA: DUF443 domain-containing protein [Staphylococcus aureus]|nr:DUF443 domain-containing protein [Staphylococcus aureus]HEI5280701.1 DUF443 domain-containing protein [Staphylococcus aureus]HEI5393648.1 DUF443 domain-containing protein [Staphylococcus aureus]HEI5412805.1 DUF443 domain-containing protein [Staphylococcus aureus]HEI5697242.1 DUF443 domain-containing protein [Staphylococcus aureus]
MLCESRVINKNPKYRIIKYNEEYFMVDLVSTWIAYFLPMINWFIPKKYAKISREEFESLNIVKSAKNNTFWPVAGFAVLLTTLTRKYIYLLNIHLEKELVILTCCMILLGVFALFIYINTKLKLHIFDKNKSNNEKIILIPTFKNICLSLFAYILFGGLSTMALSMLVTLSPQNIIEFLALIGMTACFFLLNMSSVLDKNIHVILKTNK